MYKLPLQLQDDPRSCSIVTSRPGLLHLDIPEPVVSEPRMPGFFSVATEYVRKPNRFPGTALAGESLLVEQFARNQLHDGSRRASDFDFRPSRKVLAQIVNPRSCFRFSDLYC